MGTTAQITVVGILLLGLGPVANAGAVVTYHGRILGSNGEPVEHAAVTFKTQVRSPGTQNCLLYEETRTVDMRNSGGIFVIPIGDGGALRSGSDPGILIENVFSNNTSVDLTGLNCNSDGHYQAQALDSRKLIVTFNDGTGSGDQVLPAMDVNYVPFALHAREAQNALKIGSVPATQVMSVASGAATPLSAGNFAELLALVNGTSTTYLKSSSLPSCASGEVLKASSGAFVCVTDATGTDTLAGISCADGKILKRVSGAWACADESGVGTESDPTVQAYAKALPGAGLKVVSGSIAADFGTAAGKVVEGGDSRLSDSRAPNGSAMGDLNGSYPNPTVKGIRGNPVNATTPLDGQTYKYVGGSSEFQARYIGIADLKKSDGTPQMPAGCAANETLSWSSISDTLSCAALGSLDASKITSGTIAYGRLPVGTAASTIAAGDDSRFTDSRAPTGTAGGELGGTYPNPTVAKLGGVALNVSSLTSGQVLKYDGTNWVNDSDTSGVASELDPSVQQYAKNTPAAGLIVNGSNKIAPDFGIGAGKIVEGNDARLSDNRVASDINGVVSTGIIQRTGVGAFAALGTAAPISVSGGNIGLAVGNGLTLSSGSLVPDFGTAVNKVAQGNDTRFPSAMCAGGNKMRWDGTAWQCETDLATDSSKVAKTGDTMTGALNLPNDGLVVGTSQLTVSGGNVGIGTATPGATLQINGTSGSTLKIVDGNQGSGKVLTSDSNGVASWQAAASGGGGFANLVALTSGSGNWTVPAGISRIKVTAIGGGGGNGSCGSDGYGNTAGCIGGGGGASAISYLSVTAGSAVNYSIGSGGSYNNNGGTTTFSTLSAGGGGKGINLGGAGGTASGGTLNIAGGKGNSYGGGSTVLGNGSYGAGGSNYYAQTSGMAGVVIIEY